MRTHLALMAKGSMCDCVSVCVYVNSDLLWFSVVCPSSLDLDWLLMVGCLRLAPRSFSFPKKSESDGMFRTCIHYLISTQHLQPILEADIGIHNINK